MIAPISSPAQIMIANLVDLGIDFPPLTNVELAALGADWEHFWARPNQLIPTAGKWRSWGFLTGRGYGKTRAVAEHVHREAMDGRAPRISLMAQNEDRTVEVMIEGKSGLLAVAPHWERPTFERNRVLWPNGAQAFVMTPEKPGTIRGHEFELAWLSEMVAWAAATRDEAFSVMRKATRAGYARTVWDSTPKRRHPLIRYLLERSTKAPERHVIIRGSTMENADNLNPDEVAEWYAEYGGTQRGREELLGEFFDDDDGALWKQAWIDKSRRRMPTQLKRRILAVDPAISERKATDQTGLVDLALGIDDQVYVCADHTDKWPWDSWGRFVVDEYLRLGCDCVVVERNRGGDAVAANIRAMARERGIAVELLSEDAPTRHVPSVIYVKEVNAKRSKSSRAQPVATAYERGRVSHVEGADLRDLEDVLTTWEPTPSAKSPDGMDALVHGVWELARLGESGADARAAMAGLAEARRILQSGTRPSGGRIDRAIRMTGRSAMKL